MKKMHFGPSVGSSLLVAVAASLGFSLPAVSADYTWGFDAPGNWTESSVAAGWNADGDYPVNIGDSANLTFNITAATQINLDVDVTIGALNFNDTGGGTDSAWSIEGGNTLTFDVASGNATLTSAGAANSILTSIVLNDTLDLTTTSNFSIGNAFTGGVISGSGGLNKLGAGTLTLFGTSANTYTGKTTVSAGNVSLAKTAGTNAIGGDLDIIGGTVTMAAANQIADTAKVTIGTGGSWIFPHLNANHSETIANLEMTGGSMIFGQANSATLTVTGTTTLSGGTITTTTGNSNTLNLGELNMSGGVIAPGQVNTSGWTTINASSWTITNIASGAYTPITFGVFSTRATQFNLSGNFTFHRDLGNTNGNAVVIGVTGVATSGVPAINLTGGNHDFTIADGQAASDVIIRPSLTGAGAAITKKGDGTLELNDGTSTYTGTTTVTAGTLIVSGTGSINATSEVSVTGGTFQYDSSVGLTRDVTVNGGRFLQNSSADYTGALNFVAGTLGGTNLAGVDLTGANGIGAGKVLSPGNSPGTLLVGNVDFQDGGAYLWEINSLTGSQGGDPGWDWIDGSGGELNLVGLSVNGFTLQIDSLGALDDWDTNGTYSWTIASFDSISGFDAANFFLDTSSFSDENNTLGGSFSLQLVSNDLVLSYSAIPEPSTAVLLLGGFGAAAFLRRTRRNS
jgi:autotransporter-associated beta strand protein